MNMPNPKYEHVYAILRIEKDALAQGILKKELITIKKVVWSRERAEQEVVRLNRLNADKGCEYYHQLTRLERELKTQEK